MPLPNPAVRYRSIYDDAFIMVKRSSNLKIRKLIVIRKGMIIWMNRTIIYNALPSYIVQLTDYWSLYCQIPFIYTMYLLGWFRLNSHVWFVHNFSIFEPRWHYSPEQLGQITHSCRVYIQYKSRWDSKSCMLHVLHLTFRWPCSLILNIANYK